MVNVELVNFVCASREVAMVSKDLLILKGIFGGWLASLFFYLILLDLFFVYSNFYHSDFNIVI